MRQEMEAGRENRRRRFVRGGREMRQEVKVERRQGVEAERRGSERWQREEIMRGCKKTRQ